MKQSTHSWQDGLHVAIIMDGNGRWAARRGWPRTLGHAAGVRALRRVVRAAPDAGVGVLTVFAFSSDNWQRPQHEVAALMGLLGEYLRKDAEGCAEAGVRLRAIGRRDRLAKPLVSTIEEAERITAQGSRLLLRIAVDYSARDAIVSASGRLANASTREDFLRALDPDGGGKEVDLLIRTGGEQRLSDFLLWECAYAELWFTPVFWPDFDGQTLEVALGAYHNRDRRFGGLSSPAA
ncbi:MAG: di-trans,poly-cis-decaprenylcistransferase [Gemmatimonadales bacterium]|nr:di-trans,poly-cis-decaprenylcistransferase [Gemmatimonadales bacterium]